MNISLRAVDVGEYVLFGVSDNSRGLSAEELAGIEKELEKRAEKNLLGIGLSVVTYNEHHPEKDGVHYFSFLLRCYMTGVAARNVIRFTLTDFVKLKALDKNTVGNASDFLLHQCPFL